MDNSFNATCAITGKHENITMHAFRNEAGDMIGFVFLNDEISKTIQEFEIDIKHSWKRRTKGKMLPNEMRQDPQNGNLNTVASQ